MNDVYSYMIRFSENNFKNLFKNEFFYKFIYFHQFLKNFQINKNLEMLKNKYLKIYQLKVILKM